MRSPPWLVRQSPGLTQRRLGALERGRVHVLATGTPALKVGQCRARILRRAHRVVALVLDVGPAREQAGVSSDEVVGGAALFAGRRREGRVIEGSHAQSVAPASARSAREPGACGDSHRTA
jgi:hypothetical protein